jgi:hypothetical protein
MIESTPRIITGIFGFTGAGYDNPVVPQGLPSYSVPDDKRAQLVYLRAGNSTDEMIVLIQHVSLAVIEDLFPDTKLDVQIAAPDGLSGMLALDMGLVEI